MKNYLFTSFIDFLKNNNLIFIIVMQTIFFVMKNTHKFYNEKILYRSNEFQRLKSQIHQN